jgi:hypothetical protein
LPEAPSQGGGILTCGGPGGVGIEALLARFGLRLARVAAEATIPGSFWGEPEAGLIGGVIYVRPDTPVHSALHEAAHYVCADDARRARLHTDAGGDYAEEDAVCYLQLVLADLLPGVGRERLFADMDTWGYSFRRGSTRAWFEGDAEDARSWLIGHGLLRPEGKLTFRLRR